MANPALAFLAGMRGVEMNRVSKQNRAIQLENQSRVRTLWDRQDQQYERLQLDQYRADKLAEFDAVLADIMTKNSDEIEARTGKDGEMDGQTWAYNEALKRMTSQDREFGEHFAKAVGINAADGDFVRDKSAPISAVGALGAKDSPNGKASVWFEVDGVYGMQPLTKGRSARADDEVDFREVGMQEMVQVFGKGVLTNDLRVAALIREAVGGNEYTGDPTGGRGEKEGKPTPKERVAAPEPETEPSPNSFLTEEELELPLEEQHRIAEARQNSQVADAQVQDSAVVAGEVAREEVNKFGGSVALGAKEAGKGLAGLNRRADEALKNDPVVRFFKGFFNVGGEEVPVVSAPAETPANIVEAGSTPAANNPKKIAKSEAAANEAIDKAPSFDSVEAVSATANQVLSTKGRPSIVDMYNAVGLAKLKVISTEQLMNYAQTGRFNAAAKANLQLVTSQPT